MNNSIRQYILLGLLILCFGWTNESEAQSKASDCADVDASSLKVTQALGIAYLKFASAVAAESRGPGDKRLLEFLGRMENYKITITEEPTSFVIQFVPVEYTGGSIRGGGAAYSVGKASMEIESVELFE